MSKQSSNAKTNFRPLISSILSAQQQIKYIPLKYCFSLQQISELKKYLPKTFKLSGVDSKNPFSKQELQTISKAKIKIKSVNQVIVKSESQNIIQNIKFLEKDKIGALEWYKTISLSIPYNSKNQQHNQQKFTDIFSYYLENFMHFQNNLTGNLIKLQQNGKQQKVPVTLQQMKDIDLILMAWSKPAQANDDKVKLITLNLPIVILLQEKTKYNLLDLKQVIINEYKNSFQTLMKHNFNTKILVNGKEEKRFIWLNSYCNEEKAIDQQEKLLRIIGQQKHEHMIANPQQHRKQYRFLVLVLALLVCFYLALKIYPIHPRQPILYSTEQGSMKQNHDEILHQEQIF